MGNYVTTVIDFSENDSSQNADRAFESVGESTPGHTIDMYIWSTSRDRIKDLQLRDSNFNSMGSGGIGGFGSYAPGSMIGGDGSTFEGEFTEVVSFSKSNSAQLTYPTKKIYSMTAKTAIIRVNGKNQGALLYNKGADLIKAFKLFNGSYIGTVAPFPAYYGNVNVRYQKGPEYKKWSWVVPNETATFFFFVTEGNNSEVVYTFSFDITATDITGRGPRWVSMLVQDQLTEIPLEGVEVVIDPDGNHWTATTGADGIAAFNRQIPVGAYPITLTLDGYIINSDDDLDNDFILVE